MDWRAVSCFGSRVEGGRREGELAAAEFDSGGMATASRIRRGRRRGFVLFWLRHIFFFFFASHTVTVTQNRGGEGEDRARVGGNQDEGLYCYSAMRNK